MNRRDFITAVSALAGCSLVPRSLLAADSTPQVLTPEEIAALFPKPFTWGAATSSYQIEGAWDADGKGPSIWDTFVRLPGKIKNGDTGDVACDHYHRYREDVALMRRLNLGAYRFSISWPRIQPTGSGTPNDKGLDFYKRLVDSLLEAGIQPAPTLYHWDLPQALQDKGGGWLNRDTAERFGDYAAIVGKALGDRVKEWMIFNEAIYTAYLGYGLGIFAPGIADMKIMPQVMHHLALAQGDGFRALRAARQDARISSAFAMSASEPATPTEEDRIAAENYHRLVNVWFLEAALKGSYPKLQNYTFEPILQTGDSVRMRADLDWIGINYYTRTIVKKPGNQEGAFDTIQGKEGPATANGWEVWPKGIYDLVMRISREYPSLPLQITENGCSYPQGPSAEDPEQVHDVERVAYLREHLRELARAIKDGAKVRGYFGWSLLDNFEWAEGFGQRFGLVHVDFKTQKRTPKDSALWYARVAGYARKS